MIISLVLLWNCAHSWPSSSLTTRPASPHDSWALCITVPAEPAGSTGPTDPNACGGCANCGPVIRVLHGGAGAVIAFWNLEKCRKTTPRPVIIAWLGFGWCKWSTDPSISHCGSLCSFEVLVSIRCDGCIFSAYCWLAICRLNSCILQICARSACPRLLCVLIGKISHSSSEPDWLNLSVFLKRCIATKHTTVSHTVWTCYQRHECCGGRGDRVLSLERVRKADTWPCNHCLVRVWLVVGGRCIQNNFSVVSSSNLKPYLQVRR